MAEEPFVDCVTTMLDDELPLTVGEWEEWGTLGRRGRPIPMITYSPYDNVAARTPTHAARYPELFVTAGLTTPGSPTGSPPSGSPSCAPCHRTPGCSCRTELGAGHGGPSGRDESWKEEALVLAFLLHALGLARRRASLSSLQVVDAGAIKKFEREGRLVTGGNVTGPHR